MLEGGDGYDQLYGESGADTLTLSPGVPAPLLAISGPAEVNAGESLVISLSTDETDPTANWTVVWDDGTANVVPVSTTDVSHTFTATSGTFHISAWIASSAGVYDTGPIGVTVISGVVAIPVEAGENTAQRTSSPAQPTPTASARSGAIWNPSSPRP